MQTPVTLMLANSDGDFAAIPEVERFVERVKALSRGQLQLNVISEWGQGKPSYERTVVKDVRRGKADLAWVGVRVLDTFGVKSFQALQAPLLIDSYPLQQAVLRSDLPAKMLADLDSIGLAGLSLVANELRHPFATKTQLAAPADYKGKRIRVYASEVQTLTMRALGAKPSYEGWADVRGDLTRASWRAWSPIWPTTSTVTIQASRRSPLSTSRSGRARSPSSQTPKPSPHSARSSKVGCGKRPPTRPPTP